ncbi:MAG: TldD/PmbA family protein [Proteobacteria bacterium]|nr:TldD/PmbA family protein [Pseudomonadota bacterium]
MTWTRRDFMVTSALAAGAVSLVGCASSKKEEVAVPLQQEPFVQPILADCRGYFEAKFGVTTETIDRVLREALSSGGHWGELFFEHTFSLALVLRDGIVSTASTGTGLGMGVRTVVDDQVGYAYTESLLPEDMLRAAQASAAIAQGADVGVLMARKWLDFKRFYTDSADFANLDVAILVAFLRDIEARTRAKDPLVTKVEASVSFVERRIMVNTSDGVTAEDVQPYLMLRLSVVMEKDGETQTNSTSVAGMAGFDFFTRERVEMAIDEVVRNTRLLFDAVKPRGGEWPVILAAGASGILLHEAIGHGIEADFNRKNISIFADKLNKRVAEDEVTIVDDATIEMNRGALNVDDEGIVGQRTVLVEKGVLRSYLHDKISARHYGVDPTGNGRRESYKHSPQPRMRTTYMENGSSSLEEMLHGIQYGLYCERFTNGQVLIGPGDYTFYVKNGFLIEDGKLTAPIKDVNLIGNGPDTLAKMVKVGADLEISTWGGTCGKGGQGVPVGLGMPSVLVSSLTVGGI